MPFKKNKTILVFEATWLRACATQYKSSNEVFEGTPVWTVGNNKFINLDVVENKYSYINTPFSIGLLARLKLQLKRKAQPPCTIPPSCQPNLTQENGLLDYYYYTGVCMWQNPAIARVMLDAFCVWLVRVQTKASFSLQQFITLTDINSLTPISSHPCR
jgi:hypothetical protein